MSTYASPPSLRSDYDADGTTVVRFITNTGIAEIGTGAEVTQLNSEAGTSTWLNSRGEELYRPGWIFPFAVDLIGYSFGFSTINPAQSLTNNLGIEWSNNTTNIGDGSWTFIEQPNPAGYYVAAISPNYRTTIRTLPARVSNIKAVRFTLNRVNGGNDIGVEVIHWYVEPHLSGGVAPGVDLLCPWDPSVDQIATGATLDFGDQSQGVTAVLAHRYKNVSGLSHTAHSVTVGDEILTDPTPGLLAQMGLSLSPGGPFTSTVSLGDLAPGGISAVVYQQLALAANAELSVWAPRAAPTVSSWS